MDDDELSELESPAPPPPPPLEFPPSPPLPPKPPPAFEGWGGLEWRRRREGLSGEEKGKERGELEFGNRRLFCLVQLEVYCLANVENRSWAAAVAILYSEKKEDGLTEDENNNFTDLRVTDLKF